MKNARLVLVAGAGQLPLELYRYERAQGRDPLVLTGQGIAAEPELEAVAAAKLPLGQVMQFLDAIQQGGGTDLVFLGKVGRLPVEDYQPDARVRAALQAIGGDQAGDDALLRAWSACFVEAGLRLRSVQDLLPDAVVPPGSLSQRTPSASEKASLARGFAVAKALGAVDVGQAVVVQAGLVLGLEALEGTDALITRCADLRTQSREAPLLIKTAKPQQDLRLDLPALGPTTVALLAAQGYGGVALEAGKSLLIAREESRKLADEAGLFLWGMASPANPITKPEPVPEPTSISTSTPGGTAAPCAER